MIKQSLRVAYNIALQLEQELPSTIKKEHKGEEYDSTQIVIESYQNGREQGILVWLLDLSTAFYVCQYRRSDSFGFYYGDYSMQSISEEAWKNGFISCGYIDDSDIVEQTVAKLKKRILELIPELAKGV